MLSFRQVCNLTTFSLGGSISWIIRIVVSSSAPYSGQGKRRSFPPFLRTERKNRYSWHIFGASQKRLKIDYDTALLLLQRVERIEVHLLNFNSARQGSDKLQVLEPHLKELLMLHFYSNILIRSD